MNPSFTPYDTYERHKRVAELLGDAKTVVDIGGQLNMLSQFCDVSKVTVANLESSEEKSDVTIKRGKLPFGDNSFDTSCAIDVLEHIAKSNRAGFIKEVVRISKEKAILSFPIGTPQHISYEEEIQKWLENKGHGVSYLREHIKYGLPKKEEIEKITSSTNSKLYFSGDLFLNKFLFKLFLFDPKIPVLRRIIFVAKGVFYFLTNPFLYAMLANKSYSNKVVRAYLVITKKL